MLTVGLIDDEYIVLEALKIMVSECPDCQVVCTAQNGPDGLKALMTYQPNVVFTDIRMPGMDGLTMIRLAREELPQTCFIIISGYREFEFVKQALQLNAIDYVEKPILRKNVQAALVKAAEVHRQRMALQVVQEQQTAATGQTGSRIVDACIAYLQEHYTENIGLPEAAQYLKTNPSYLCAQFRECAGVSFVQYVTKLRLKLAKERLLDGEKATHVAQLCGYSDYHYFCRVFKKYEQMSPNEYKERVELQGHR